MKNSEAKNLALVVGGIILGATLTAPVAGATLTAQAPKIDLTLPPAQYAGNIF